VTSERPDETEAQRADRNFGDILQELRVTQTGVQILFAFLLTLPLQNRFTILDRWERGAFVAALLCSALAAISLIAPVAYHRALYARLLKHQVVIVASRFAVAGLFFLGLAIVFAVDLVLDVVQGRTFAVAASAGLALVLIVCWLALPLDARRLHPVHGPAGDRRAEPDAN
jgi:hypothetical protein